MNQTIQNIFNRRSVRAFKEDPIPKESLKTIIEAGLYAPSAHNQQPWHFTVIQNQELLAELNAETKKVGKSFPDIMSPQIASNEKFNIFYAAPTIIIVSGKEGSIMPETDCAAATENMLIAAEALGIASCWIGFVALLFNGPRKAEYQQRLRIPEGYELYYAIALGYSKAGRVQAPPRKAGTVTYL